MSLIEKTQISSVEGFKIHKQKIKILFLLDKKALC